MPTFNQFIRLLKLKMSDKYTRWKENKKKGAKKSGLCGFFGFILIDCFFFRLSFSKMFIFVKLDVVKKARSRSKPKQRTKIVVRHLPPELTKAEFDKEIEEVSSCIEYLYYMCFDI